ncbi:MAG TPA: hypothetical protein VL966_06950 [Alphaproteobacteria bacterium]|nr:hypothetical protein [Alphaproteobacteria bacterium]
MSQRLVCGQQKSRPEAALIAAWFERGAISGVRISRDTHINKKAAPEGTAIIVQNHADFRKRWQVSRVTLWKVGESLGASDRSSLKCF